MYGGGRWVKVLPSSASCTYTHHNGFPLLPDCGDDVTLRSNAEKASALTLKN